MTPRKVHRRDRNTTNQLKMRVFDTKAHKKTERAQKRQFFDTKAHKKTEKAQKRQTPKRW